MLNSYDFGWSSVPASLMRGLAVKAVPHDELRRLEDVEADDCRYDLLIETRVSQLKEKDQTTLRPENVAVLALSADRALLVTEAPAAAPKLQDRVSRFPVSAMTLVPVSEMSAAEASREVKSFVRGLKLRTRGHDTVCCLRTDLGHEVWLQMDTADFEKVRERLTRPRLAA